MLSTTSNTMFTPAEAEASRYELTAIYGRDIAIACRAGHLHSLRCSQTSVAPETGQGLTSRAKALSIQKTTCWQLNDLRSWI